MLMVVGMATVFVILLIVIYLSKYLITVVNKVAPEETPKKAPAVAPTADTGAMDAIKAAVSRDADRRIGTCGPQRGRLRFGRDEDQRSHFIRRISDRRRLPAHRP